MIIYFLESPVSDTLISPPRIFFVKFVRLCMTYNYIDVNAGVSKTWKQQKQRKVWGHMVGCGLDLQRVHLWHLADYCLVLAALGLFLPATSHCASPVYTFAWVLQTSEAFQQVL